MAFLEVAGRRFEIARVGPARQDRPTLLFLHEGLGCVSLWRDFPARLAEATGCPGLVVSRLGYGRSDPVPLPRPLTFMHEEARRDVPDILEAAGIEDAILVGHSDGASIALIYAGENGARLRGVIVEAPHVFVEDFGLRSIAAIREAYETTDLRERLRRHHGDNVDIAFRGWADVWLHPEFRKWNLEEFLPGISCPLLVVQGEDDEYGTLEQVRRVERGVSGPCRTVILPQCGHSPHRDQPERTIEAMAEFVAGLLD